MTGIVNGLQSMQFCQRIVGCMIEMHGLDQYTASSYLEQHWNGQPIMGSDDSRYHRLPEEWAEHIIMYRQYLFG